MNNKEAHKEKLFESINEYFNDIQKEVIDRWNMWEISMENKQLFEVIGGLLARQVAITTYFLQSSTNWNSDFAPIILRVLSENYLTTSFILHSDSLEKAKKYVDYGLGREKLHLEKLKQDAKSQGKFEEMESVFKDSEEYWSQFKYTHFQDINLALWTNKNMREICEELDEKDFYNLVDPMNDAVHGTFNHLIKYNLKQSDNPLHQSVLVPAIEMPKPNIEFAERAAILLDKTFEKVDVFFPLKAEINSSARKLVESIDKLAEELRIVQNKQE